MPDLMQFLRMRNIFGQQPPISGGSMGMDMPDQGGFFGNMGGTTGPYTPDNSAVSLPSIAPPAVEPQADAMPDMADMFHPHYEAQQKYNQLAGAYPNRADYKPSIMRRIGGALMAFSGGMAPGRGLDFYHANPNAIKAGIDFMEDPFNKAQEDWSKQIVPAQQAATMERYQNANERQAAYQTASTKIREKAETDKAANDARKAANAEARTRIYQFKAEHPNAQFRMPKGGNIQVYDPSTKQWTDSGIATGTLSEMDQMDFKHEDTMEEIGKRTEGALSLEGKRQSGREKLQSEKGWTIGTIPDPDNPGQQIGVRVNADTGEVHPIKFGDKGISGFTKSGTGAGGGRGETAQAARVRMYTTAREILNTRPDLAKYLKFTGGTDFQVAQPRSTWGGEDLPTQQKKIDEINRIIYGTTPPGSKDMSSHAPTTPVNGPNNTTNPPQRGAAPNQGVMKQYSPSRNQTRISTDGGQTWKVVPGRQ